MPPFPTSTLSRALLQSLNRARSLRLRRTSGGFAASQRGGSLYLSQGPKARATRLVHCVGSLRPAGPCRQLSTSSASRQQRWQRAATAFRSWRVASSPCTHGHELSRTGTHASTTHDAASEAGLRRGRRRESLARPGMPWRARGVGRCGVTCHALLVGRRSQKILVLIPMLTLTHVYGVTCQVLLVGRRSQKILVHIPMLTLTHTAYDSKGNMIASGMHGERHAIASGMRSAIESGMQ